MDRFTNKTTMLGIACLIGAVAKTTWPQHTGFITIEVDVLFITGLGLIFGRDAINKIGK